jgi:hypothetical protein
MADAVVAGAMLCCTCGTAPAPLKVTSQTTVKIGGSLAANVTDNKPMANVGPFGACATLMGPCVPACPAPWAPGSGSVVNIDGMQALRNQDKLQCAVGGTITILEAGQEGTHVDT